MRRGGRALRGRAPRRAGRQRAGVRSLGGSEAQVAGPHSSRLFLVGGRIQERTRDSQFARRSKRPNCPAVVLPAIATATGPPAPRRALPPTLPPHEQGTPRLLRLVLAALVDRHHTGFLVAGQEQPSEQARHTTDEVLLRLCVRVRAHPLVFPSWAAGPGFEVSMQLPVPNYTRSQPEAAVHSRAVGVRAGRGGWRVWGQPPSLVAARPPPCACSCLSTWPLSSPPRLWGTRLISLGKCM